MPGNEGQKGGEGIARPDSVGRTVILVLFR